MVALSPALILAAFINWDLLAMALTAGAMAAWAGRREVLAGLLLGLAVAAKFYPLLIFAALLLLCLRAGRMREFGRALAAGAVAWLVVNLPIALAAPAGWGRFYAFSRSRGADWGSIWYLFEHFNVPVLGNSSVGELPQQVGPQPGAGQHRQRYQPDDVLRRPHLVRDQERGQHQEAQLR